MRIGSLKKMIGFEYKGQVAYITRIDDFRDYMEPEVYEAVRKAFENGCDGGLRQEYEELQAEYEELQAEYDELQTDYSILEDEADTVDCIRDELSECEEQRDSIQEKYDALTQCIESLIEQYYQRYITQEDIIPELEKMI